MRFSRRTFIGGSLAFAAAAHHAETFAAAAPGPDLVEVAGTDPAKMVSAAIDALGGIGKFVRPGDYVVLKPNAGFANPAAWGTTTNPDVVVAVAKLCLDAKAKQVLIVEYPQAKGEKCLERCGLNAALAAVPQVKVKVLSATGADFQKVEVKQGVALKSVEVAKALLSADVFINIPVAKHHFQSGVSFGLKNHMGLIQDRQAFHTMLDLHQAIADLGRVVKPHLTLLDATRALLTNGPAGPGETVTLDKIVAGRAVASVDAYGLTLARFNQKQMTPADAPHIQLAAKAGLGTIELEKLSIKKLTA
ncbi:MAG: DUF362 domain-containing protein [Deltaproteobacteria bacterium]|nr:DUF362 domain-containing protein [Deltaproteobacteria bacterium]